jgi:hypothetical protein
MSCVLRPGLEISENRRQIRRGRYTQVARPLAERLFLVQSARERAAYDAVSLARPPAIKNSQIGTLAMNRFERRPIDAGEAKIEYLNGDFRILRPGAFVRCAVTGEPIPLDELRYWSVDRQEAYATPAASMKRESERL